MIPQTVDRVAFLDLGREQRSCADRLEAALRQTVERGCYVMGPALEDFEGEFARYIGARHVVGVASGQDALELILRALDLGPEDEVIVPAMTFVATANAVLFAGARLVLCDVGPDGLIDPERLERAISPRSRVVIPVHLHGRCADMERIGAIAAARGLRVVEDACQAHGAKCGDRRAGGLGHAAAFSFYPTKNLGCLGDGGAVVTDDAGIRDRVRLLRNYGSPRKYRHEVLGRNSRLDEIQAAVLRVKLEDLDERNRLRRRAAARYHSGLAQLPLRLPVEPLPGEHVYHVFAVRLAAPGERDALQRHLTRNGIDTLCHYPIPLNRQPSLFGTDGPSMQAAERFGATTLSLPMFPLIRPEEVDLVTGAVVDFFERGPSAE